MTQIWIPNFGFASTIGDLESRRIPQGCAPLSFLFSVFLWFSTYFGPVLITYIAFSPFSGLFYIYGKINEKDEKKKESYIWKVIGCPDTYRGTVRNAVFPLFTWICDVLDWIGKRWVSVILTVVQIGYFGRDGLFFTFTPELLYLHDFWMPKIPIFVIIYFFFYLFSYFFFSRKEALFAFRYDFRYCFLL